MTRRTFGWMTLVVASLAFGLPASADPALVRVEAKRVCMMNDSVFPKDQIAVPVGDKTYYGCCEMCKGRLANDPEARVAVDPVSGKSVDKATAVIGATPEGKVLYFENEGTFARYGGKS